MDIMNIYRVQIFTLLMMLLSVVGFSTTAQANEVDLELVLAMDGSNSISNQEYITQLQGTADAFRDPSIHAAITSGPIGKIAVTVMVWSDAAFPKLNSGWFLLDGERSSNAFAAIVERFRLTDDKKIDIGGGGGTGIGAGVEEGLKLMRQNRYVGLRKVIDISGDGIETEFWFSKSVMIRDAKLLANVENVTVNGLPIVNPDYPELDTYYRENVITGPGSFIIAAEGFDDFKRAIRKKLLREISSSIALE